MKRIFVVGHFAFGKELLNGQTIKTKTITEELEKQLGKNEVATVDTHSWKVNPCKVFNQVRNAARTCENIIMMPAHNGVLFFAPLLYVLKRIYRIKINYIVIGGWLPDLVRKKKLLRFCLRNFDGIYVETNTMKSLLEKQGFNNIFIMPNCKNLKILNEDELVYDHREPFKLCTFSRVMKEKGIEDAVHAVVQINEKIGRIVFTLDIYGQIDTEYKNEFSQLMISFPEYIKYKGYIGYDQTTETLKDYFALLFPTRFYTEGIPGTIIDAYAAGVPVIASEWENFSDLIDKDQVGYGYMFGMCDELVDILILVSRKPELIIKMKASCLDKAIHFDASKVIKEFLYKNNI